jgi:hypothetical protein
MTNERGAAFELVSRRVVDEPEQSARGHEDDPLGVDDGASILSTHIRARESRAAQSRPKLPDPPAQPSVR